MDAQTRDRFALRAHILRAMAHPTRLCIVDELAHHKQCVFRLAELIEADMSTVSRHLKMLKEAGIIKDEKHGTLVYYHLNVPCVKFLNCLEEIVRDTLMNVLNQV